MSASGRWPLPSTPARPTISPARTWSRQVVEQPVAVAVADGDTAATASTTGAASTSRRRRTLGAFGDRVDRGRARAASERSDTGRPTIACGEGGGVRRGGRRRRSTTAPPRMIVTSSVACRISSSLWLTRATARPSSTTTWRSTANSCSLSAGVSTRRRFVEDDDRRLAAEALDDLDPLALAGGAAWRPTTERVDVEAVALADLGDALAALSGGRGGPRSPSTTFSHTVSGSTRL